jgi:hypothetical protein
LRTGGETRGGAGAKATRAMALGVGLFLYFNPFKIKILKITLSKQNFQEVASPYACCIEKTGCA